MCNSVEIARVGKKVLTIIQKFGTIPLALNSSGSIKPIVNLSLIMNALMLEVKRCSVTL